MKTPKNISREVICLHCGEVKKHHNHIKPADHVFEGRLETTAEAYYRVGFHRGYEKAADKAHWGIGWN